MPRLVDRSGVPPEAELDQSLITDVRRTDPGRLVLPLLALSGLVGCGEIYLGEREWTCTNQAIEYPVAKHLAENDRLWRFNDVDTGADVNGRDPFSIATKKGMSQLAGSQTRIGGEGSALIGDSHFVPSSDVTIGRAVTYAVWMTLPKSWLKGDLSEISLISSMPREESNQPPCGGHDLTLRRTQTASGEPELSLVFRYFGTDCARETLTAQLNDNWIAHEDSWGMGNWHHVAATIAPVNGDGSRSTVSLYWDGVARMQDQSVATDPPERYAAQLRVGATGSELSSTEDGADDRDRALLAGNFDDVALFQRALNREAIAQLRLDSLAKYGLDGLRWATWDVARSLASWAPEQSRGLAVNCQDGAFSGCGATALLDWQSKFNDLDHLVLSANLPKGKTTDIVVSADDGWRSFCKWTVAGIGGADYTLSVKKGNASSLDSSHPNVDSTNELKWCKCDSCDCDFEVAAAQIGSEWTGVAFEYPCLLCGLRPYKTPKIQDDEFRWRRGALGPNNWCWRPIAYDVAAHAHFAESPRSGESIRAVLTGPAKTTALLAADFGTRETQSAIKDTNFVRLGSSDIALTNDTDIVICAYLPKGPKDKENSYQIILKSANDGYCLMKISAKDVSSETSTAYPQVDSLTRAYCVSTSDANSPTLDEAGNSVAFDPEHVRYLGIQKTWVDEMDVTIRIDSVNFSGNRSECFPQPRPANLNW